MTDPAHPGTEAAGDPHRLDELDLLALADGHLDHDPVRKVAVQARLAGSPEADARAHAFAAQTAALRRAYGHRLAEPVPERLHAALVDRPARPRGGAIRAAAAVLLTAGAAAGGWLLGQGDDPEGWSVAGLLERSHAQFAAAGPTADSAGAPPAYPRPLGLLADAVSIRVGAPDLSAAGYTLVATRAVGADGESGGDAGRIVRLDYAATGGRAFSLFLSPRWDRRRGRMRQVERDGVSLAYWLDGPLASALVTRLPAEETREIAERVRHAMRNGTVPPPVIEPAPGGVPANGGPSDATSAGGIPASGREQAGGVGAVMTAVPQGTTPAETGSGEARGSAQPQPLSVVPN